MVAAADLAELESLTWEMERRGLIPPDFGAWLERARPEFRWDARHFRLMQSTLDRVTAGELTRVLLQVAGRHGKTETVTSYGAYRLALDPSTRILLVTYSQPQARKVSRMMRRLARKVGVSLSDERDSVDEWETTEGGGLRVVGIGSGTASINADLIIIDDPIGNRAEAESLAHRERVWDAITTDILARCEPHTAVVFSMPRWHKDDPAGRAQDRQSASWTLIDLPGRSEGGGDMLGRPEGEPLWPEERGEDWHRQMRLDLGEYGYSSFIMCRPRPREGGMFKWDWWKVLGDVPVCSRYIRYWDLAGTEPEKGKSDPDFTAGTLMGRMEDGRSCIVHQAAFRKSVAARDAELERIAREDRAKYGHRVEWWIETESGIAGKDRTAAIKRRLHAIGLKVSDEPATGSKEIRAEPLASAADAGNVCLAPDDPTNPWHDAFRDEAADFPHGRHDDRVDSASGAYNKLTLAPNRAARTFSWKV